MQTSAMSDAAIANQSTNGGFSGDGALEVWPPKGYWPPVIRLSSYCRIFRALPRVGNYQQ